MVGSQAPEDELPSYANGQMTDGQVTDGQVRDEPNAYTNDSEPIWWEFKTSRIFFNLKKRLTRI